MKEVFRPAARFVVINENKEILLVEQKNNWAIPGGGIDFGENICDAISREAEEELGIKAKTDKLIFVQDFCKIHKGENRHCFEFFYSIQNNEDFENVENTYKMAEYSYELKDVKYFKIKDFPENFKPKALVKIIDKYLEDKQNFSCEYTSGL